MSMDQRINRLATTPQRVRRAFQTIQRHTHGESGGGGEGGGWTVYALSATTEGTGMSRTWNIPAWSSTPTATPTDTHIPGSEFIAQRVVRVTVWGEVTVTHEEGDSVVVLMGLREPSTAQGFGSVKVLGPDFRLQLEVIASNYSHTSTSFDSEDSPANGALFDVRNGTSNNENVSIDGKTIDLYCDSARAGTGEATVTVIVRGYIIETSP